MERYFVRTGEFNVHLTEWGEKGRPVIVCLHGLGSTSLSFIEVAEQLQDDFRIISIDAPGHGKTPPFDQALQYEMPSMVKWLNHLITYLEIDQFYFLSHSWGSFVALYYVKEHSDRVLGSILIDGGYQTKRLGQQSMEEEVAYYEKDFEEYVETWEEFLDVAAYGAVSNRTPLLNIAAEDLALEKDNKFYWHARGETAGHIVKAMHKHETADIYEDLPSGILLLRATLPAHMNKQRKLTADIFKEETGATVNEVPGTTHMLHWDNPLSVVHEIKAMWLAKD